MIRELPFADSSAQSTVGVASESHLCWTALHKRGDLIPGLILAAVRVTEAAPKLQRAWYCPAAKAH